MKSAKKKKTLRWYLPREDWKEHYIKYLVCELEDTSQNNWAALSESQGLERHEQAKKLSRMVRD